MFSYFDHYDREVYMVSLRYFMKEISTFKNWILFFKKKNDFRCHFSLEDNHFNTSSFFFKNDQNDSLKLMFSMSVSRTIREPILPFP